jgi:hypothetical protein
LIELPMTHDANRLPPHIWLANYDTDQKIARYRGHVLIEAMPRSLPEDELFKSLEFRPHFTPEARDFEPHLRIQEILGLANYMDPKSAHIQLAIVIDSLMREGYVGRRPFSPEHVEVYQNIHNLEQQGKSFRQSADSRTPKLSTALISASGMGKTTTVERFLARFPTVIYHPKLDIFQVTYLHIETPSDGRGVKALAIAIIEKLDELLPQFGYFDKYLAKSRAAGDFLIRIAARLMNKHLVGLLIADEIQNAANARKEDRILMAELKSLCNQCKIPQLYIGTHKANKLFDEELQQGRRGIALALGDWGPMPRWEVTEVDGNLTNVPGEWQDFVEDLWAYQWLKQHAALTPEILKTLYECTQGIIDLILKLFMIAQIRAILDQTEILTDALLLDVYEKDMKRIHPMVDALRSGDVKALMRFEDLAPVNASDLVEDLMRRYRGRRYPAASGRPGTQGFEQSLAAAAEVLGVPADDAAELAKQVNTDGTAKNMLDAAVQLVRKASPHKPISKKSGKTKSVSKPVFPDLTARPSDYRNAAEAAAREGGSVQQQLDKLKMLVDVEDLFSFA